jgi:predicted nucleic acid-binding protein
MTTAVLDACVLYAAALRDLFMHLTVRFVFQPKWTEEIHAEWIENVLEHGPGLARARLERARTLMDQWARDWHVPDHMALIPTLSLPDPDDRHVLAAAIAGEVPCIVTFDLSHFPEAALAPHGIRARHPDEFACDLLRESPEAFLAAVRTHRASLKHPPKSAEEYLATLSACGLPRTAAGLAEHLGEI